MEIFDREIKLIGIENFNKITNSKVLLFGLGGVGSYVFEGLVRAGIGQIDIVDKDVVDVTNLNRQLISTLDTIGKSKVKVAKERALNINPNVVINEFEINYTHDNSDIDFSSYDFIIDAIDDVKAKISIISRAKENGIKVISSMGTGNKLDPSKFEITDISKTSVCPLARVIRKELKEKGIKDVPVLYSKEEPIKVSNEISSISFVPSVAGLLISSYVIKEIIK